MHHTALIAIALWLADSADECHGIPFEPFVPLQSALRVRFGENIFRQLSRVIEYLFNSHVKRTVIGAQQQCFPEGCVKIQDFRLIAHRAPSFVTVVPTPPNLLTLRISNFDFYVTGTLYGQLQPVPLVPVTLPVYGTLTISATQLVVGATFDVQKTVEDVPYIRVVTCSLLSEIILARVENMGLLTGIVNAKYQYEIMMKAREVLQESVCISINNVVNTEINNRFSRIPNRISILELYRMFFEDSDKVREKFKRALGSVSNYSQMHLRMQTIPVSDLVRKMQLDNPVRIAGANAQRNKIQQIPVNLSAITAFGTENSKVEKNFFSSSKLTLLILSLSILDTSATYERFFAGLDGNVYFGIHDQIKNPYQRPQRLRFPQSISASAVDLLISEYTINTLLLKAHVIGALIFNVQSTTPVIGKLLRTSCTLDEVCLSDSIPEAAERYPNKQLEVILRTTQPPTVIILEAVAIIVLEGRALFFIEGTTEKVGEIPFRTESQFSLVVSQERIVGWIKILTLDFLEDLDFFELSVQSVNGFKEAVKGAVVNMINGKLKEGIPLHELPESGISKVSVKLVDGAVLLQTNFDVENSFYQYMSASNTVY